MPARPLPDKFLVAFSFAGEQRDLVRALAETVEGELGWGTVFFDEWFEHYLAGADADLKLAKLYAQQCELAVVCVAERYGGKPWTQAEHEAIRARLMQARASKEKRERDAILPIRVGDGEVEGVSFNTIAPDVRQKSVAQAAELIVSRLRLLLPALGPGPAAPELNGPLGADQDALRPDPPDAPQAYLAECTADLEGDRSRMRAFLKDVGWRVLPTEACHLRETDYRARLKDDLLRCRGFVQLLGPHAWKPTGFDRIQSEAAATLSLPRFRYRSPDIDLKKLGDAQGEFLAAPDVIAAGFEDFKAHLAKRLAVLALHPEQLPAGDRPPRVLVVPRCENPDPLLEKVFQWVYDQQRMEYCQLRRGEPFEAKVQAEPCHGFLIVCDASALNDDERSPRDLMEECRQIQLRQKDGNQRPPVGLVYWPPPSAAWSRLLRTTPLKLHRILGDQPASLDAFFAEVRRVAE
jgi:hypothetical protein